MLISSIFEKSSFAVKKRDYYYYFFDIANKSDCRNTFYKKTLSVFIILGMHLIVKLFLNKPYLHIFFQRTISTFLKSKNKVIKVNIIFPQEFQSFNDTFNVPKKKKNQNNIASKIRIKNNLRKYLFNFQVLMTL